MDNTSAHAAHDYDGGVLKTIPHYQCFHRETLAFIRSLGGFPGAWLDAGGGTGTLVALAAEVFPQTRFTLADPSPAMLALAKEKLRDLGDRVSFVTAGSQNLDLPSQGFQVITAIQAHHYFQPDGRLRATLNCQRMLVPGGVFISFENIRPSSPVMVDKFLAYWKQFQTQAGKTEEQALAHLARFDQEYFPLTVEEHLELYRRSGFAQVEILWKSYLQAGFVCFKEH